MVRLPLAGSDRSVDINPSKIIALGLNYREHIAESPSVLARRQAAASAGSPPPAQAEIPAEPVLFCKTPNVLVGPGEAIVIPAILSGYSFPAPARTDYEAELAFIISKRCRNIAPEEAWDHILGFTCFNDVSQRNIQNGDRSGWFRGKSFDSFGPIGPRIVPASLLGDPQSLAITCRLNGRTVQSGSTADMIFPIPLLLSYISRNLSLEPGDIVSTGTPSGVGPLAPGDTVEVEVEGIGILSNPVIAERIDQ